MSNVPKLRADAVARLQAAGVDSAESDVGWLLAQITGLKSRVTTNYVELTPTQFDEFASLVAQRAKRVPLQHLLGEAWFRHLTLEVGPGVFIPRPETEVLVDLAISEIADRRIGDAPPLVVDLCTGSAVIPIALATEAARVDVIAVEADLRAAEWAAKNLVRYESEIANAGSSLVLHVADVAGVLDGVLDEYVALVDVLTCNPPYIPSGAIPRDPEVRDHDPAMALFGGDDGLDVVRVIADVAAALLKPGGALLVEHGDEQGEAGGALGVPHVLRSHPAFEAVADHTDLTRRPRVTIARRNDHPFG